MTAFQVIIQLLCVLAMSLICITVCPSTNNEIVGQQSLWAYQLLAVENQFFMFC